MRRQTLFKAAIVAVLLCLSVTIVSAAVQLSYFAGRWEGDTVALEWGTATEYNHTYFNVWRSEENLLITSGQIDRSRATRVNGTPIGSPSGGCSQDGNEYTYRDTTVNPDVQVYYYYLESVNNCEGANSSEFYGAANGSSGLRVGPYLLYLPLISTRP
jgi:hypothetical protein